MTQEALIARLRGQCGNAEAHALLEEAADMRGSMSTQHTPGPWKAYSTGLARSGFPEYQIHWSEIGECVAEVVHGTENARLIAAAPDLLEALKLALRQNEHDMVMTGEECRQCFAAIAKATGGNEPSVAIKISRRAQAMYAEHPTYKANDMECADAIRARGNT